MPKSRTRALLNLSLLVGLPTLVAAALFAYGVYLGDGHRDAVVAFERDYLQWTGLVPPAPPVPPNQLPPASPTGLLPGSPNPATGTAAPAPATGSASAAPPATGSAIGDMPAAGVASGSVPGTTSDPAAAIGPERAAVPAPPVLAPDAASAPGTAAANLEDQRLVPVTIQLKVLVDERLVRADPGWFARVQRTVATASRIYRADFGIELSLSGVVRWARALDGLGGTALLAELKGHGREGADVLLGFVAHPLEGSSHALGAPSEQAPLNGAYALVGQDRDPELPHVRGLLRALGHLLGARSVLDPTSDDYRLGSWMSEAPAPAGRPPWIDLPNRRRILLRKARPFEPEPGAQP